MSSEAWAIFTVLIVVLVLVLTGVIGT